MSKDTLQLPKTAFSMKANLPIREPEILELWKIYLFFAHFVFFATDKSVLICFFNCSTFLNLEGNVELLLKNG